MGSFLVLVVAMGPPAASQAQDVERGRELYRQHCPPCHGEEGRGQAGVDWQVPGPEMLYPPPPLDHSAHAWHHGDDLLARIIALGGKDGRMPAWREKLSAQEIRSIVHYLHTLWLPEQLQWQRSLSPDPQ